jgi:integrin beta 8
MAPPISPGPRIMPTPRKPRRGLLVGVAAAVVAVLVAVGVFFVFRGSGTADPFPVGSCVRQAGGTGVAARCTDAGAFTVVSRVDNVDDCPDKSQPYLQLTGVENNGILCLAPAVGSGGTAPTPTPSAATPSSTVD